MVDGAQSAPHKSLDETSAFWVAANRSNPSLSVQVTGTYTTKTFAATPGGAPTVSVLDAAGGHGWPGTPSRRSGNSPIQSFNGSEMVWSFLKGQRRIQGGRYARCPLLWRICLFPFVPGAPMFRRLVFWETGVLRAVLVVGSVVGLVSAAAADGRPGGAPKADWSFIVGGGGLYTPDYEGSDDYRFRALPYFRVQYQDWVTLSVPEGLKVAAINDGGFKAGAIVGYRFDRDAGDNLALRGWGDVDGALELGGFAEYKIDAIKLSLEARQGVSGDDTGLIATLGLRYETRIAGTVISVGPKVSWVDDDYAQTYFGITPAQAAASFVGYAPYAAGSGIKDYGVGLTAVLPLGDAWSLTGIASVSQLTGDAADSPIVAAQGSETQVTLGLFAGYRF